LFYVSVNQILLFLLVLTLCTFVKCVLLNATELNNIYDNSCFFCCCYSHCYYLLPLLVDLESVEELEEEIPVVLCAAAGRMGAAIAAINSIYTNTDSNVLFYIVGIKNSIPHIRQWIENSILKDIKFKIVEFNPMVLKGKIRPDATRPELLQPVSMQNFLYKINI
uniref:Uncharacterized protein n=1 Tax=Naja naja TaxID=35670 RepID=A0A8C6Y0K6_NAJNA